MLLARKGHRVLLLDRDRFPSDMGQSTHLIHPLGVAHLRDWGVLPQIAARAAPFTDWRVDLHGTVLSGPPPAVNGRNESYGPRRYLLDGVLAAAAVAAGAEFRDGVRVVDLVEDGGRVAGIVAAGQNGARHVERARLVIGADGPNSVVARCAGARESLCEPIVQSNIWSYWEGIALDHVRLYIRERKGAFAFPASDGTVLVAANLMHDEFVAARRDRESAFLARVEEVAPDLRAMLPDARRVEEFPWRLHASLRARGCRPRLGAGGRCGDEEGPGHRAGHLDRIPLRRDAGRGSRRRPQRPTPARRGARRLPEGARRLAAALLSLHRPARPLRQADRAAAYYSTIQNDPADTARLFGAVALTHSRTLPKEA